MLIYGLMNPPESRLYDLKPERESFRAEVLGGLLKTRKQIPSKYLYDDCGSRLYERICALDEYYLPRIEMKIMQAHIAEIAALLGRNVCLIEYGCGNCAKTRFLIDNLPEIAAFVPLDISREQLMRTEQELSASYPGLEILPVCADFTGDFDLPVPRHRIDRTVVYFPGSTIGNFEPQPAISFLRHVAGVVGPGGAMLIGIDLKKDSHILYQAYNDREGVTAAFNLNLLERINRELGADFHPEQFRHRAFYNAEAGRVEMHLESLTEQTVHLDGISIPFEKDETIWTESSYKFDLDGFAGMAGEAGFEVARAWTDAQRWFSVQNLARRN